MPERASIMSAGRAGATGEAAGAVTIYVGIAIVVVIVTLSVMLYVMKGPQSFMAKARRDFAETQEAVNSVLDQDLRDLAARLEAAELDGPATAQARDCHRVAAACAD